MSYENVAGLLGEALEKAVIDAETATTAQRPYGDESEQFGAIGELLTPPFDPARLFRLYQRSSVLRPNVSALMTNVDSFGFILRPRTDLTKPTADEDVRDSMLLEALDDGTVVDIGPEAVASRKLEAEGLARIQRLRAQAFLATAAGELSLTELRRRRREDLEVTGSAYIEVLRNTVGEVSELRYAPSPWMRVARQETEMVDATKYVRVSPMRIKKVKIRRRFRRYAQVQEGSEEPIVWFKEFGDPRIMSATSGRYYASPQAMARAERKAQPATEIMHFTTHNPLSVYGLPCWIGAFLAVVGTRDSEEVNVGYFQNKAVPPLAVLVSGGQLREGMAEKVKNFIRDSVRGKENFHSILVIEAMPGDGKTLAGSGASQVRIELKPLTEAQHQDALFQQYEANNGLKVGAAFRIPKLLRGDAADINRSTADAAMRYAEQQVFQPPRSEFDVWVNDVVFPEIGISAVEFVSRGPIERDPDAMASLAKDLASVGGLTPNEVREVASEALNMRLDKVDAGWAQIPVVAAAAGFAPAMVDADGNQTPELVVRSEDGVKAITVNELRRAMGAGPLSEGGDVLFGEWSAKVAQPPEPSLDVTAARLVNVRDALTTVEQSVNRAAYRTDREQFAQELKEERLLVPQEQFNEWFDTTTEAKPEE